MLNCPVCNRYIWNMAVCLDKKTEWNKVFFFKSDGVNGFLKMSQCPKRIRSRFLRISMDQILYRSLQISELQTKLVTFLQISQDTQRISGWDLVLWQLLVMLRFYTVWIIAYGPNKINQIIQKFKYSSSHPWIGTGHIMILIQTLNYHLILS